MKRLAIGIGVIAAFAVGGMLFVRAMRRPTASVWVPPVVPAPAAPPIDVRPATPEDLEKEAQEPLPGESWPIRVLFETGGPAALKEAIPVDLVVKPADPETFPAALVGEEVALEYLLRLPSGVQLKSEGWTPVELPPGEKNDPTGVWSLFELKRTLTTPSEVSATTELARERVELAVAERGANWVITARVRWPTGSLILQAFGVVFATVDDQGRVEFHAVPRGLETQQRAETD